MTLGTIVLLVILVVCIGASGFFSGSETAVVAIPRERVARLAREGTRGRRLAELVGDMERTIGTLLVANNFVNILGASVATILVVELLSAITGPARGAALGPWASTLALTAVILVVGEITPKTLAARRPERFALFVAPTIWWLGRIIAPIAGMFTAVSRWILRRFGVGSAGDPTVTEDDIRALAALSMEAGEIENAEHEILDSLFELADRPVRDVMTPRLEVISLQAPVTEEAARRAVATYGHSRFPVLKAAGTLDDAIGILYVKDLIGRPPTRLPAERLAREPFYIPESSSVLTALQEMRRNRVSIAFVLDEHGGIDGIVTVKDLIAELVGEIQDEYDPDEPSVVQVSDTTYVVDGRMPVEDVADKIHRPLPEGPYATIGGLYLAASGTIPSSGDWIQLEGVVLTVLRMDRRRIDRLRIDLVPGRAPSTAR